MITNKSNQIIKSSDTGLKTVEATVTFTEPSAVDTTAIEIAKTFWEDKDNSRAYQLISGPTRLEALKDVVFENKEVFDGLINKEQVKFHPVAYPWTTIMYLDTETYTQDFDIAVKVNKEGSYLVKILNMFDKVSKNK